MLKLSRRSDEPYWLDLLPGVRVRVRPITVAMMMTARRGAFAGLDREKPAEGEEYPPLTDEQMVKLNVGVISGLAHAGIVEWDGVGDAGGSPIGVSAEAIDDFLDVIPAFDALDVKYYQPAALRVAEKNG